MPDDNLQQIIRLVQSNPNDPQSWIKLGELLRKQGDEVKATDCFQRARMLSRDQIQAAPSITPPVLTEQQKDISLIQPVDPISVKNNDSVPASMMEKAKQTSSRIGQTLRETDWVGKGSSALDQAGKAAKVVSSAASQAGQFIVENKETVLKAGQAVTDTTLKAGRAVETVGQVAVQTGVKASKVMTTFQIMMIVIAVAVALCSLSVVALVVYQIFK